MSKASQLPIDEDEQYEWFMQAGVMSMSLSAAIDLAFRVENVRTWLIENDLVAVNIAFGKPAAYIDFGKAIEMIKTPGEIATGLPYVEPGLGVSDVAVLWIAGSLSGKADTNSLYPRVCDLEEPEAKLAAEAIMYAAGFMDGVATPYLGTREIGDVGPRTMAFDERAWS